MYIWTQMCFWFPNIGMIKQKPLQKLEELLQQKNSWFITGGKTLNINKSNSYVSIEILHEDLKIKMYFI